MMRALALAALLILSASSADARYVRVWGWAWQPDPPRRFVRSPWDLAEQEREAIRWARHCRIMYAALGWRPFGCR